MNFKFFAIAIKWHYLANENQHKKYNRYED